MSGPTQYGFDYGPMRVERVAHDDRIGWVVTIRPLDAYEPSVTVRVSLAGRSWTVQARGGVELSTARFPADPVVGVPEREQT